jgi:MFS family permease
LIFAAFRVRSFRFQWPADLLTSWAFEMETLILGWYVMVQTGSVLLLTVFGSLQFLGTLAAPMFGVLGDRLGSRDMLCVMRTTYVLLAVLLMLLGLGGMLTPASVLVIAALGGITRPNDLAMRNALIGDTISRDHLTGALGLSRATSDSARVGGALVGAGLSSALGIGWSYAVVAAFYIASLGLTFGVSRGARATSLTSPSNWRDLTEGLAYVWSTPKLLAAMCLAFLVNLTAYPVSTGLLPYVVREIYVSDATGLGRLAGSFALGALLGSVGMVVTQRPRHPERSMVASTVIWYVLLLLFGQTRRAPFGMLVLFLIGIAQSVAMVSMAVSLLRAASERFRGRVMGARQLAVYGLPVGLMASGALIDRMGFASTISLYCLLGLAFTAIISIRWRGSVWHT